MAPEMLGELVMVVSAILEASLRRLDNQDVIDEIEVGMVPDEFRI
jgi:hypothetical protein